ncbi:MAG: type III pantothenate kinase [Thermostichus sp. DG_1_6_bins_120]
MSSKGSTEADPRTARWLAAVLGNTHVRWGWFCGQTLLQVEQFPAQQPLAWPQDTEIWLVQVGSTSPPPGRIHPVQLQDIPLPNLYPSLGVDRALALWAAGIHYGWPCLVIDAGTALTLTGADGWGSLVGGAILPGLGLQALSLQEHTACLPKVDWDPASGLPPRWARDTVGAIRSGILYTLVAGLHSFWLDWQHRFPTSRLIFTGGDGGWLYQILDSEPRDALPVWDPHLVLKGVAQYRQQAITER